MTEWEYPHFESEEAAEAYWEGMGVWELEKEPDEPEDLST